MVVVAGEGPQSSSAVKEGYGRGTKVTAIKKMILKSPNPNPKQLKSAAFHSTRTNLAMPTKSPESAQPT